MGIELTRLVILIKGGGEVASGVAHRLARAHFKVCLTETAQPLAVSRGVAFCEAIYDGKKEVEGVVARRITSASEIPKVWQENEIPIIVDPEALVKKDINTDVLVDAMMAKRNLGTKLTDAPLVIGLGPGFEAGKDVHMVVETNNSNNLGKVILKGEAEKNTGTPVAIGGLTKERIVWAPQAGIFTTSRQIGDSVKVHQTVGWVGDQPLLAPISGILRGLMRNGVRVGEGSKLIEVDPVNDRAICYAIRDKMRAIAGGVLEAILMRYNV
jgi:xanthine dehydrogenase accessory factor